MPRGESGGLYHLFSAGISLGILVSQLCCGWEGGLVLTSWLMGALRLSLVMSSSQPGGLVSQELIRSLGILLQWNSEHPCPPGRRGSTAKAAQQRQRWANTRGTDRSHLAPGTSIRTVVRCHGITPGSSSRSAVTAGQKSAWDREGQAQWLGQGSSCLASKHQ